MRAPAPPYPRECPRATFWAGGATTEADAARLLLGSQRVHAIEGAWLERMRTAQVFAYRLPEETFDQHPEVGGYWISRDTVEPLEPVGARRPAREPFGRRD